ncbi:polysaccharide pyruvyl transferase family protein [Halostagnicola sp. A-GB9-2]|uniref:polysaccharide pyruvyl transferase family protein n=1 Tax=Halostagnicola sp. A-GB9-2 TaxID=3048066 RepID=UPI0024C02B5C|nr:polysaccharide pyruvyl transferase family protein [Halostagnicola sp. A-GB9-2]MDJ1434195.1 polysaccharide pyruvyl transferase family protein [Halostagnicola sp. A-GB9-2]
MPKIGILTYHNNENRGAILQAYCLQQALSSVYPGTVEVIEYRTKSKERGRRISIVLKNQLSKVHKQFRDRRIVEEYIESELSTSDNSIVTDDHNAAVEWLEAQDYDALVTGSDEIWKVIPEKRGRILSKFSGKRPFPNAYFLDPRLSGVKAAYAASANRTDIDQLSPNEREQMSELLSNYDLISVRDSHTEQVLAELGIHDVVRVPDPTLLCAVPSTDPKPILEANGIDTDSPILGIHSPNYKVFEDICDHYRDRGFQIVTPKTSPFADTELKGELHPYEYYALYDEFDMVATNSLHSTIFSIKSGIPFTTIDVGTRYVKLESKTYSLLEEFGLLNRHIDATDGQTMISREQLEELERKPDETHIQTRITELQEQGIGFLERIGASHETNH